MSDDQVVVTISPTMEGLTDPGHSTGLTDAGYQALVTGLSAAGYEIHDGPYRVADADRLLP